MSATIRPLQPPDERVLVMADWTVDPHAVVAAACRRLLDARIALVVPARLHGLDWAGDPHASCPCAQRQLSAIAALAAAAGIELDLAAVGDPDPVAAIGDVLADWSADRLLMCTTRGLLKVPRPLGLAGRTARATGLPVAHLSLAPPPSEDERHGWLRRRRGHCSVPAAVAR